VRSGAAVPFREICYPNPIAAKQAIADYLNTPLGKVPGEALERLNTALAESLRKADVLDYARDHLKPLLGE
jgi:hypothetical protein